MERDECIGQNYCGGVYCNITGLNKKYICIIFVNDKLGVAIELFDM
jgi:hypothetical protein